METTEEGDCLLRFAGGRFGGSDVGLANKACSGGAGSVVSAFGSSTYST